MREEEGQELIRAAREAIEYYFQYNDEPQVLKGVDLDRYSEPRGVFVTLKKHGELRGCIGYPLPIFPLGKAVVKSALAAAFEDSRFGPLSVKELKDLEIEISVLTVPEKISVKKPEEYLKKIKIGRDGLLIEYGMYSGLFLPQVPTEQKWGMQEYLDNLCMKAGMPPGTWKQPGVVLKSFQAEIFEEKRRK
jgi:uncharacterized protein (TIGR00296 family)